MAKTSQAVAPGPTRDRSSLDPVRCILSVGANNAIIERLLVGYGLDVVERHELQDGYTLSVLNEQLLDVQLVERILDHGCMATKGQQAIDWFLFETERGTPSRSIFSRSA